MPRGAPGGVFRYTVVRETPGYIKAEIEGKEERIFTEEHGGHRFQRVPPTEKKGRVHTSTVTVAVTDPVDWVRIAIDPSMVREQRYSGSGGGGQHRNKHANCVRLIHKSGVKVQVEGRHYHKNRAEAHRLLQEKLQNEAQQAAQAGQASSRKAQMGSGMRGDKRRTCSIPRDKVIDHVSGWEVSWKSYLKGAW